MSLNVLGVLHGVPRGRPYEINKLAKSHKGLTVHMVGIYAQSLMLVNISKTRLKIILITIGGLVELEPQQLQSVV